MFENKEVNFRVSDIQSIGSADQVVKQLSLGIKKNNSPDKQQSSLRK